MAHLAFDIYGTLIDPYSMESVLRGSFGADAAQACELWRHKQIEYSFRRAAMKRYQDFEVCTEQALMFTAERFGVALSLQDREGLLEQYRRLPAYPDVATALPRIAQNHRLAAFSNGTERAVRGLLEHAGIAHHFLELISVDEVKSFKPDPAVYEYLARRLDQPKETIWMVSSNPFDVIGAKSAGLKAIWLRRDTRTIFDPWEFEPDQTIASLSEIPGRIDH